MTNHPYKEFESHPLWAAVNSELSALEENQDVQITTRREYVVGSIVKACVQSKPENLKQES